MKTSRPTMCITLLGLAVLACSGAPLASQQQPETDGAPVPAQLRETRAAWLRPSAISTALRVATNDAPPPSVPLFIRGEKAAQTWIAAGAGSIVGILLGWKAPSLVAPDDCQETCAGQWVTVPAGSILGAAAGASLAGRPGRRTLKASALGFATGLAAALVLPADTFGGALAFALIHGGVTAALSN